MPVEYLDLEAGTIGNLTNGDTAQAATLGATTIIITNGTLAIAATSDHGPTTRKLVGTGGATSGSSYVSRTLDVPVDQGAFGFTFRFPTLLGTSATVYRILAGGVSVCSVGVLSTEQLRYYDAAGATLFTTTFSGGFVAGQTYRFDGRFVRGTSTTDGTFVGQVCLFDSTSPLAGTTHSPTNVNMGTAAATSIRQGTRAGTGLADDNLEIANFSFEPDAVTLIGPRTAATPGDVTAPPSTGTASTEIPVVTAETSQSSNGPATGSITSIVPVVTGAANVTAIAAQTTVAAAAPAALAATVLLAPTSTSVAAAVPPSVTGSSATSVTTPRAAVTSTAPAPQVVAGGAATVAPPAAQLTVSATSPTLSVPALINGPPATGSTTTLEPTIATAATITSVSATTTTTARVPQIMGGAIIPAPVASTALAGRAPFISAAGRISAPTALTVMTVFVPTVITIGERISTPDGSVRTRWAGTARSTRRKESVNA